MNRGMDGSKNCWGDMKSLGIGVGAGNIESLLDEDNSLQTFNYSGNELLYITNFMLLTLI